MGNSTQFRRVWPAVRPKAAPSVPTVTLHAHTLPQMHFTASCSPYIPPRVARTVPTAAPTLKHAGRDTHRNDSCLNDSRKWCCTPVWIIACSFWEEKKNLTTVVVAPGIIFNFTCVLLISFLNKKKDIFEFKIIQWLNL